MAAGGLLIEDIANGQASDNPFVRMLAGAGAAQPPDPDDEQGSKSSKATVTSRIRGDTLLEKAAQQVGRNPRQQKDVDGIVAKFQSGISNPGIGSKSLPNTDVYYLRTRSGARVFFRNNNQGFEIVGKANKGNEDSVIARLTQIYGR